MGRQLNRYNVIDYDTGKLVMSNATVYEIADAYNMNASYVRILADRGYLIRNKYAVQEVEDEISGKDKDFCEQWNAVTRQIKEHYERHGGYVFRRVPNFSR